MEPENMNDTRNSKTGSVSYLPAKGLKITGQIQGTVPERSNQRFATVTNRGETIRLRYTPRDATMRGSTIKTN
jgi:hypothetical protein